MFYSACDVWGCLPIIVSTSTTTIPTTPIEETRSNVLSTDVNHVNKVVENSGTVEKHLIYGIATLTLLIVSTVIISVVWYRRRQKKKRSEKTKLIKVVVLMAQQSVLTETSTVRGERSAVNDHPENASQFQGEQSQDTLRTHQLPGANGYQTPCERITSPGRAVTRHPDENFKPQDKYPSTKMIINN